MSLRHNDLKSSSGLLIAGMTALISGVSVFVNSYGVRDYVSPAVYTTAKNLVAALVLLAFFAHAMRQDSQSTTQSRQVVMGKTALAWRIVGLAYVGIVGGGVAFVLFFDGLARTAAAPAAFLHDTLVIFVGLIAWPALRERLSAANVAAIGLLIAGEVVISGGFGHLGVADGPALVLGATVLWAIETVIVKRLLATIAPGQIACARMGIGVVVLVAYLVLTGHLGSLGSLDRAQLGWALLTGALLAAYVATWFTALARARAIDVTSVLVGSVVVTSLLEYVAGHPVATQTYLGIALVVVGIATLVLLPLRRVHA
jgi:drug/metabolite transporter (DMT)-like permease